MKSRGITVTSAIKASQLILNMRSAENLDEAFIRYRKSRADLAESGYHAVLHAFSRISRSLGHPDMLEYYLLIVGDMRLAGFTITDRVYTDILQQFAEIGNMRRYEWRKRQRNPLLPRPANMFDDLLDAVRQIHDLITVDPSIKPERIAWNQLIDTYQRLESFPEAYRVWETMYFSGKYGPIAVSIILDGCGFAGEHAIAKQIVGNLQAANYVFNLHNWNSYIECLCRLNDMSEALKVICTVMGTVAQPVKPEPSTIAIMIKFADTRLQTNTVLTQVRRHLPDLWEVLPQNPQNMEPPPDVDQPP
jgi:pentatricopeptide repeat protein